MKPVLYFHLFCGWTVLWAAFEFSGQTPYSAAVGGLPLAGDYGASGFWDNPALSANTNGIQGQFAYVVPYSLRELSLGSAVILAPIGNFYAGLGLSSMGNNLYRENRLAVNLSRTFFQGRFFVGLTIQGYLISVVRYGHQSTWGMDMGFRYQLTDGIALAGAISNINQPRLAGHSEEIPQAVRIGALIRPLETVGFHLSLEKDAWFDPQIALGMEYRLTPHFTLLSGFRSEGSQPSGGIQLLWNQIEITYSLQYHFELGATHLMGVVITGRP